MRIFQTFLLPEELVREHQLSFAAANFSRNLLEGAVFDDVYSLIPLNVRGKLPCINEVGYKVIYSNFRNMNSHATKFAIFYEQWKIFKLVRKVDSLWLYNLNIINSFLFLLIKVFKPSIKLNIIVLEICF